MERRAFLLKGEVAPYKLSVQSYQRRMSLFRQLVIKEILYELQVPSVMWNRSATFYAQNSVYAPQLDSIVKIFPCKQMIVKNDVYKELEKQELFSTLVTHAEKMEDIYVFMFLRFVNGDLKASDVPSVFDESVTRMYDDFWLETGLEEEEVFNDFYYRKAPYHLNYI